ncbi:MAG: PDZ domain-containing protein [Proteobacteria bacterium]|nr:PDZ domain-containing protein [Pseudomonadota bacterium]
MRALSLVLMMIAAVGSFSANAAQRSKNVERASYSKGIAKAMKSVVSLYAVKNSQMPRNKQNEEKSLGSGVIVSKEGLIVTNSHIVLGAEIVEVLTPDNNKYTANIIATDKSLDLAILKINSKGKKNFIKANFANSDSLRVGDVVFSLGNPFGVGQSASMGIVSALGRVNLNIENAQYLIQTDAAVNPGNSGGALIDVDGNVVGISSSIMSKTANFSGVSFAVPSNAVKFIIDSLTDVGEIKKSWFGVRGENITQDMKKRLRLDSKNGVYVTQIAVDSPAHFAGVKVGDVLVKIHNFVIMNTSSLTAVVPTLPVNRKMMLEIIRKGKNIELDIKLKSMGARGSSNQLSIKGDNIFSGLVVEQLSQELNYMLGLPLNTKGFAVVDKKASKNLNELNILVGDIILAVNGKYLKDIDSMKKALAKSQYKNGWNIKVLRAKKEINLFVK